MNTATSAAHATSLRELLHESAGREAIYTFLDGLEPHERVAQALSLRGKDVARLYRAVEGGRRLGVEDFLPASMPSDTTVIFEGRNSLPMFSRFQKRFARLESGQVVGYNHQTMAPITGPGFFVVKPPADDADVPGELYFDYTAEPNGVPSGWPSYKANASGLSSLVYANMKDYMREVAPLTYVGEAYKLGKKQNAWFILTRPGD
jgi:hypothetical protein